MDIISLVVVAIITMAVIGGIFISTLLSCIHNLQDRVEHLEYSRRLEVRRKIKEAYDS